ncbi:MAG: acyltransferase [Bacteroidales bacterium]|nr:acyltransferase [Bacteroidales bacterium]
MKNCNYDNNNFFNNWFSLLKGIEKEKDFNGLTLKAFKFQYDNNKVYKNWCNYLGYTDRDICKIEDIPFLPISFFKTQNISCLNVKEEDYFLSSGTTTSTRSKHYVYNKEFYIKNTFLCFEEFFSKPYEYSFLCLLPNYLEQTHSSLICMMDAFVRQSKYQSGFFKDNLSDIVSIIEQNESKGIKTILFGVTYALLDLIKIKRFSLKNTTIFETGGMKGRRKEMPKEQLHNILKEGFGVESIASEYGMCELFSQAYSLGDGIFHTPKQMKVCISEINDWKSRNTINKNGIINVIDLANIATCCFIETEDVGRMREDGKFEIIGRLDHSETRGCNLMYSN